MKKDRQNYDRARDIAEIVSSLLDFYKEPTYRLIAFLYRKHFSQREIGEALGVSRQAVAQQYPKQKLLTMFKERDEAQS